MGFFGNWFGGSQQQQQAPDANNTQPVAQAPTNPYDQVISSLSNPVAEFLGGANNAQLRAQAQDAKQKWDAQQKLAAAFNPQPVNNGIGGVSVTDGGTATAPQTAQPGATAPSTPGPMDVIAAAAQGAPSGTGGTYLADTGPSPTSQSATAGAPAPKDLVAQIMAARAQGVDTSPYLADYDAANPGYVTDNTPREGSDVNGTVYQVRNGVATDIRASPPRFVQYQTPMGQEVMGYAPGAPSSGGTLPPQIGDATPPPQQGQSGPPQLTAPPGSAAARNNNPWNLRGGGAWQGMTGQDASGFDQFDTPADGLRAAQINLANQQKLHGVNTIQDLIARESPSSDGNNVASYVNTVAKQSGFSPTQKLDFTDPAVQSKVLQAIFNVEGGGTPTASQGAPASNGAPMTGQAPSSAGFQPITLPGQTPSPDGKLDPQTQSIVDAIGKVTMAPLPMNGKSPRNEMIMAAVQQQYPNFDADAFSKRQETTKNFFNGAAGKQLGSLNTAIEHLSTLADSVDQVDNGNNPAWMNGIGNAAQTQIPFLTDQKKQGALNALDLNIQGALHEAMSAYKAAGGSEGEFNGLSKDLDVNGSKTAQYAAIQKVADMLNGKRQQLLQQYQTGMGGNIPAPAQLLDPNADAVMSRIDAGAAGLHNPAAGPPMRAAAPSAPQRLSPQQAAALPSGTRFVGLDGVSRVKH